MGNKEFIGEVEVSVGIYDANFSSEVVVAVNNAKTKYFKMICIFLKHML